MGKILFLEDNQEYRQALKKVLEGNGHQVDTVDNSEDGIGLFANNTYDLVISDLFLPDINGVQFLAYIKKINSNVKTIILTGDETDETHLNALDMNVDQYLVKNIRLEILLKHIDILINKVNVESKQVLPAILISKEEGLELDIYARTITQHGQKVHITFKEFEILKLLLSNKGVAVSREEILEHAWDDNEMDVDMRIIDGHIKKLRRKLKLQSIWSVRGYGYKWEE